MRAAHDTTKAKHAVYGTARGPTSQQNVGAFVTMSGQSVPPNCSPLVVASIVHNHRLVTEGGGWGQDSNAMHGWGTSKLSAHN